MKLIPKWLKRAKTPAVSDDFWYSPLKESTKSGVDVDEFSSLNLSAVFDAIRIIAQDIGSLPCHLYRGAGPDKIKATEHPLYNVLLNQSNPHMSAMTFREVSAGHCVSWGNTFIEKDRDGSGQIIGLWPITPNRVKVELISGRPVYEISVGNKQIAMTRDSILHIPGMGWNGISGYSVLTVARESIALGLGTEEFGAKFFGEGTNPGGIAEHPNTLTQPAYDRLKKSLRETQAGLGNAHKLMILEEGMSFKNITIPPEDAQFLQTRQFQIPEIGRWFNIQPSKLKDHSRSTFSNIEHLQISHVVDTIRPWLVRIEQCYNFQLLTEAERAAGYYFKHNVEGLLRGDSKARGELYKTLWGMGAMNADEIRELEDMNPLPDGQGKIYFVPMNYVPIEQALNPPEPIPAANKAPDQDAFDELKKWRDNREKRSIAGRDRIQGAFYPLILSGANKIISRETLAIKKQTTAVLKNRSVVSDIEVWLEDFYRKTMPELIKRELGGIFRSYAEEIQAQAALEVGAAVGMTFELESWVRKFTDDYILRHTTSSAGQLAKLLRGGTVEDIENVETRADEWHETRGEKIARNESVRLGQSMAVTVFFAAGFRAVWRNRGETCPYCKRLSGKVISEGGYFAEPGTIEPDGEENKPMKIRNYKRNPPLHQGCDCYTVATP